MNISRVTRYDIYRMSDLNSIGRKINLLNRRKLGQLGENVVKRYLVTRFGWSFRDSNVVYWGLGEIDLVFEVNVPSKASHSAQVYNDICAGVSGYKYCFVEVKTRYPRESTDNMVDRLKLKDYSRYFNSDIMNNKKKLRFGRAVNRYCYYNGINPGLIDKYCCFVDIKSNLRYTLSFFKV